MMRRAFHRIKIWPQFSRETHRCVANEDGVVALEFALILPLMITLFFGVLETSLALLCRADVSILASTTADLISQAGAINTADVSNVYNAASTVMYPYYDGSNPLSRPTIRLTSVIYDTVSKSTTAGKVAWTCTLSGTGTLPAAKAVNDTFPLPQAIMTSNSSVIVAEVAYGYTSPTTKIITSGINFTNNFYTKPRRVAQIAAPTGGCPT